MRTIINLRRVGWAALTIGLVALAWLVPRDAMGDKGARGHQHPRALASQAPGPAGGGTPGHGEHGASGGMGHMHAEVPPEYAGKAPPPGTWSDPSTLAKGREIYTRDCLACHGERGDGKGPAAVALPLKPADFTNRTMVREMAPDYWFWRVMEGGQVEPYKSMGSAMPPWKGRLTEEETWAVIAYQHTFSGHRGPHTPEAHPELRAAPPAAPAGQLGPHVAHAMPPATPPKTPALELADLEQMALKNNPTVAQAEANIRAAAGRRLQAGLYPNPVVGYNGTEFAFRIFNKRSEHFAFVEQSIVTAGKLQKSRNIFAQEQVQAEAEADAQRLVEVRRELAQLAREASGVSGQLYNVGQADRPDVLESEVEAQRAELELISAQTNYDQAWQVLAAVVGDPALQPTRLAGDLEADMPILDQESLLASLLRDSPEIKSSRARVEPIPDLLVRTGIGYSTEPSEALRGRAAGWEAEVQVGVRLPLFDRNQGNIAAAQAELEQAEGDLRRLELALRARLAPAFSRYFNARRTVERYQQEVLPRTRQAYELYLTRFRGMAAAYPQVLIAQRTLFQAQEEYVNSLIDMHQNVIIVRGFLLTNGLDAPSVPGVEAPNVPRGVEGIAAGESPGIRTGTQGAGVRSGAAGGRE